MEQELAELAAERASAIEREFSSCISRVRLVATYFASSEHVTPVEFRTYVSRLTQGLGEGWLLQWVPYVRRAERAACQNQARDEGRQDFEFKDLNAAGQLISARDRSEYFPIYYQYPENPVPSFLGLDLSTNAQKLALLQKACDAGEVVVLSRGSHLPQSSDDPSLLVIVPVFHTLGRSDLPESHPRNLTGLVIGLLQVRNCLNHALVHSGPRGVIVHIADSPEQETCLACWLYEPPGESVREVASSALFEKRSASLSRSRSVQIGDRQWLVTCLSTPAFEDARQRIGQWILLFLGLATTGLVAGYFHGTRNYTQDLMEVNDRLVREIDERERIASSLKENERFLSMLLANLPGMVYRCRNDRDWTMVFVSDGCIPLTGYPPADLLENARVSYVEVIHPEDRSQVWDKVQAALAKGTEFELTYRIRTAGGEDKWVWERGRGVFSVEGNLMFLEGFVADITEQKLAEDELARYRENLEARVAERTRQLDESKEQLRRSERLASLGTFAAGIAHEINNPVGTMLLAAENALELCKMPGSKAVVDDCLRRIVSEARRCGEVIQSVLQFARQQPAPKTPTSIEAVIRRSVEMVAPQAQQQEAIVDVNLDRDLPEILLNALQMEQVFLNLLRNALEAGKRSVRVEIRAAVVNDRLRVTVCDNGPGIPGDHLPRIFDPFFTTRRERGGTGLGLSLAHAIIVEHGGQISVHSRLGNGTTFTIDLPLH
ncbi:MAG: ATP-binding protein [Phycisphaerae bacterium]